MNRANSTHPTILYPIALFARPSAFSPSAAQILHAACSPFASTMRFLSRDVRLMRMSDAMSAAIPYMHPVPTVSVYPDVVFAPTAAAVPNAKRSPG